MSVHDERKSAWERSEPRSYELAPRPADMPVAVESKLKIYYEREDQVGKSTTARDEATKALIVSLGQFLADVPQPILNEALKDRQARLERNEVKAVSTTSGSVGSFRG